LIKILYPVGVKEKIAELIVYPLLYDLSDYVAKLRTEMVTP